MPGAPSACAAAGVVFAWDRGRDGRGIVGHAPHPSAGALNGGPQFPFTEAISFQIVCTDQEESDQLGAGDERGAHQIRVAVISWVGVQHFSDAGAVITCQAQ